MLQAESKTVIGVAAQSEETYQMLGYLAIADQLLFRKTGTVRVDKMLRVSVRNKWKTECNPQVWSRISLNSCCDPVSDMNKADPHVHKVYGVVERQSVRLVA